MKSKRFALVSCLLVSLLLLNGCADKKYADAEKTLNDFSSSISTFVTGMENAQNAQDVAKALNNHADEMKKIIPRLNEMGKKYPEIDNADTFPEELMDAQDNFNNISIPYSSAIAKIDSYLSDPAVQKAQKYFNEIMMMMP